MEKYNFTLDHRKFVCPEYIFGQDSRFLAGKYALNMGGSKVFLVTDQGVEEAGWASDIIDSLESVGLEYVIFDKITPNPRDYEVHKGVDLYLSSHCDLIVCIGGGSAMDCAKAIGIIVSNGGHIIDYEGVDKINMPIPPLICIPTTSGTSADVSQFSIILNTSTKVKIAIISKAIVPDLALIDPIPLTSMSNYLTACTGIDALVHAIEAYVSNASSYFTDMHAFEAIKLITENLPKCIKDPLNSEYRGKMMLGSLEAGLAFSNASLGCVHAMAHSLGGLLDLPHGECNALLLEYVMRYNYDHAQEKYKNIASFFDLKRDEVNLPEHFFNKIKEFKKSVGINNSLKDTGVTITDLDQLSENAIKDPCVFTNPRKPDKTELKKIYIEAL